MAVWGLLWGPHFPVLLEFLSRMPRTIREFIVSSLFLLAAPSQLSNITLKLLDCKLLFCGRGGGRTGRSNPTGCKYPLLCRSDAVWRERAACPPFPHAPPPCRTLCKDGCETLPRPVRADCESLLHTGSIHSLCARLPSRPRGGRRKCGARGCPRRRSGCSRLISPGRAGCHTLHDGQRELDDLAHHRGSGHAFQKGSTISMNLRSFNSSGSNLIRVRVRLSGAFPYGPARSATGGQFQYPGLNDSKGGSASPLWNAASRSRKRLWSFHQYSNSEFHFPMTVPRR